MADQWQAVYRTTTGELVSVGTVVGALPAGLTAAALAGQPDQSAQVWDTGAHVFVPRPVPTDDKILAALPRVLHLTPTAAAGKAALRDFLDDAIKDAQAWDWFTAKIQADTVGAAAKAAVAGLAAAAYTRAKNAAVAWAQSV